MRIISGSLKGKKILGFDIKGTRPTMDRVKESVFSSIQNNIKGKIVLDLFAGSGNLGIEALSNGAKFCYFNDINKEAVKIIKTNLNNLNITVQGQVLNYDYKKCLTLLDKEQFDLIFLDPPYKMLIIENILNYIITNNLIKENGIVVCETANENLLNNYSNLIKFKEKKYGFKKVYIYRRIKNE